MSTSTSKQIGLGTAAIGRPQYINIRQENPAPFSLDDFIQKAEAVLDEAYINGIRYYDTAPGYGIAEQILINWVKKQHDPEIEVATKWGYTYTANFDPNATVHEVKEHSLRKLNEQWEQSKRLVPNLSTYQIHSATLDTGVLENTDIHERLYELKTENSLLMGITTSGTNQIEIIRKALDVEIEGAPLFDTFQITYNMLDQSLATIADQLLAQGKRLIIKEALANGRILSPVQFPHYQTLYQSLREIAEKYNVGIDAVALRFCIDTLHPFTVLSGVSNPEHISLNLKAFNFTLDEDEITQLKSFQISPETYWTERKNLDWT